MTYPKRASLHEIHKYSAGSTTPTKYYYVLNMQGDIVQLRNSSYNVVANYTYDAWGKLLNVTNASGTAITSSTHIANVNPIRYRGYFYDTETKLYYCNSRYYDPQVRRFINADDFDVLHATPGEFTDKNLFAYCDNNPVMRKDNGGEFWHVLAGAVAGGVIGAVTNAVTEIGKSVITGQSVNWSKVGKEALRGAITGTVSGAVASLGVAPLTVVTDAALSFCDSIHEQVNDTETGIDWGAVAIDTVVGTAFSYVGCDSGAKSVNAMRKTAQTANKAVKAASKAGKGMAPAITKAASTAISRYRRESFRYFTNSFGDGFVSSFSSKFSSEYSKLILR